MSNKKSLYSDGPRIIVTALIAPGILNFVFFLVLEEIFDSVVLPSLQEEI